MAIRINGRGWNISNPAAARHTAAYPSDRIAPLPFELARTAAGLGLGHTIRREGRPSKAEQPQKKP
jgi:hypothetical protein